MTDYIVILQNICSRQTFNTLLCQKETIYHQKVDACEFITFVPISDLIYSLGDALSTVDFFWV